MCACSHCRMANTGLSMNDCLTFALIHGLDPSVFAGKNQICKYHIGVTFVMNTGYVVMARVDIAFAKGASVGAMEQCGILPERCGHYRVVSYRDAYFSVHAVFSKGRHLQLSASTQCLDCFRRFSQDLKLPWRQALEPGRVQHACIRIVHDTS